MPTFAVPTKLAPDETLVYSVEVDKAKLFQLGERVAEHFKVGPYRGRTNAGVWQWQDRKFDLLDGEPVVLGDDEIGNVSYESRGINPPPLAEVFDLDQDELKRRTSDLLTSFGFDVAKYTFDTSINIDPRFNINPGIWTVEVSYVLDGATVSNEVSRLNVYFGRNYTIDSLSFVVRTFQPIGSAKVLTLNQALNVEPQYRDVPLKGVPKKVLISEGVAPGRWILLPGWSLPVISGVDTGVITYAISAEDRQKFKDIVDALPAPKEFVN